MVGATTGAVVSIELLPAIPMIKLSPYFSEATPGNSFPSTLEFFNIERFYSGSFAIAYNPNLVSFTGTVSQVGTAWGDLITFAQDLGDTVILSVSRTTTTDDTAPTDSPSLVQLGFNAVAAGEDIGRLRLDIWQVVAIATREVYHQHQIELRRDFW